MPTNLLNEDGTASMATLIMCSHHAFRRDLASFAEALAGATPADELAQEWTRFRAALHGHHTSEDNGVFPNLRAKEPRLAAALDTLEAQHHTIDPLLERGDQVFADLANQRPNACDLVATLSALIAEHLDLEERTVIPHLRDAKEFPLPPTDEVAAVYAEGFAWALGGISTQVVDRVFAMVPAVLAAKIPVARLAFDERSRRVWGHTHTSVSVTSVPTAS